MPRPTSELTTHPSAPSAGAALDARWTAVVTRDRRADGTFFYAVETTGVYCQPSCAARTPRRENVSFHQTAAAAERAGFRACKRCKPGQPSLASRDRERIVALCRFIAAEPEPPTLAALARRAACSPSHLHRMFKAVTGLTPHAYANEQRAARVRAELARGSSVTQAVHESGFASTGRFYEQADRMLGMMPSAYRAGGKDERIQFAISPCSLGLVLVAASARGVCAIALGSNREALERELAQRFLRAQIARADPAFDELVTQVVLVVEAPERPCELPLDLRGTAFQAKVWQALRAIPAGQTLSYRELAERIATPRAVRAVARACASNPLAIAVPCHRVLRGDGELAGYRWGIERKRALLAREAERANQAKTRRTENE